MKKKVNLLVAGDKGDKIIAEYEVIRERNFSEAGDFAHATRLLTELAELFREIGGKKNIQLASRIDEERETINNWFKSIIAVIKKE
jgi:hypothetical protein